MFTMSNMNAFRRSDRNRLRSSQAKLRTKSSRLSCSSKYMKLIGPAATWRGLPYRQINPKACELKAPSVLTAFYTKQSQETAPAGLCCT